MNTTSLWIIRIALSVQFVCVLAVPALVADLTQEIPKEEFGVIERAVHSMVAEYR